MPVMAASNFRNGTRVRISAPSHGARICRIEDIRYLSDMPDLGGFGRGTGISPREILREWNVSRVATISFHDGGDLFVFNALEIEGEWFDLRRQALTIEVVGQDVLQ